MYVGYKYGTSGSLENNRLNTNDSTIKTYVDNWYKNNLTAYTKYLSKDAVYCNDRNLASGQSYSTTSDFNYASVERLGGDTISPTYNCTNMSDAFSVNNTSAKLDYPIGLMTIDELSYAGGDYDAFGAPYAWYYTNANGESITGGATFLSLSPRDWSGFSVIWCVDGPEYPGGFDNISPEGSGGVRPSVSLLSCNLISRGDGSPENPYVVYTGSGVCE